LSCLLGVVPHALLEALCQAQRVGGGCQRLPVREEPIEASKKKRSAGVYLL
jgi:hypothetical protein